MLQPDRDSEGAGAETAGRVDWKDAFDLYDDLAESGARQVEVFGINAGW